MPDETSGQPLSNAQIKLASLVSRRERIFMRVQQCFDLSKEIKTNPAKTEQFKIRCLRLNDFFSEFEEIMDEIYKVSLSLNPKASNEPLQQQMSAFEDMFYLTREVYDKILTLNPENTTNMKNVTARLPKIELKTFDGKLIEWPEFKANYVSLIHQNSSLDIISKFNYLRSALKGPALAVIKELQLTEVNYMIAWDSLVLRYENKRILGSDLLNKVLHFPSIKKETEVELKSFTSTFGECVSALKALELTDLSDFMLLHIALQRLPIGLIKAFERGAIDDDVPSFDSLMQFVHQQIQILELVNRNDNRDYHEKIKDKHFNPSKKVFVTSDISAQQNKLRCLYCNKEHHIYKCAEFLKSNIEERFKYVKSQNMCFNCLSSTHNVSQCIINARCKVCNKKHHTLIHLHTNRTSSLATSVKPKIEEITESETAVDPGVVPLFNHALAANTKSLVLLGTAQIRVRGQKNQFFSVRAVIDSAAMSSFITLKCARRLGLTLQSSQHQVAGLSNQPVAEILGRTDCIIQSGRGSDSMLTTQTLVISRITAPLPVVPVSLNVSSKFRKLDLADPKFDEPGDIDFLIGADLFPYIFTGEKILRSSEEPCALNSIFGWVIVGKYFISPLTGQPSNIKTTLLTQTHEPIENLLRKFWEVEDIKMTIPPEPETILCDKLYEESYLREPCGRFSVPLLIKPEAKALGESFELARSRFLCLEKRLNGALELKASYANFMKEYEVLGHMTQVKDSEIAKGAYYIPHHCVFKNESTTTKIRVVFDASMKTTSGVSLNDILSPGPKLQNDIVDILSKFRTHAVVFTADICKMYRQINVLPNQRKYQHILWRENSNLPLRDYELNTVTYGLASSPYLAIKSLHQLAKDEQCAFPEATKAICDAFYVDDILTGSNTVENAITLKRHIVTLLAKGGFELRKWASNSPEILRTIPKEFVEVSVDVVDENKSIKILGVLWNATRDCFSYKVSFERVTFTKQGILSVCARIYDPLGWIAPVIFKIKCMLQQLWLLGLDWDTTVPNNLKSECNDYFETLSELSKVKIPRFIFVKDANTCFIIGFSDASTKGYGAVVYLYSSNSKNEIKISLLIAKSKVAPVKTISVPRLELCGAVLLAKLLEKVSSLYSPLCTIDTFFAFTDSTVVLSWLRSRPCTLKTFVANRVTYILEKTEPQQWYHVASHDNPADLASRGCEPKTLNNSEIWWSGPCWLKKPQIEWPIHQQVEPANEAKCEAKSERIHIINATAVTAEFLVEKYSSLFQLKRIFALVMRFIHNCRTPSNRQLGNLTTLELERAEQRLALAAQSSFLHQERQLLMDKKKLPRYLQKLNPFLDEMDLLRVGGRLANAPISNSRKFPILLPKNCKLTELIIDCYHKLYLHVGPRTLQSLLSRSYWIISARQIIRSRLSKCTTCFKARPTNLMPQMGALPMARVTQGRPFINVGTDFGGPFLIKDTSLRKARQLKAYICLFVCFSTKAIHLEPVSSLSTPAFLATFDRFCGRRGLSHNVYSDCATNYVGARNCMSEIMHFLKDRKVQEGVQRHTSLQGVTWHFNPPSAPHFGGLWEAGVKSVKYHLKRVIGDQCLTFEEFTTVLCKVEAMLNSRPLCPLSEDPGEIDVLTPGHFLIGAPLMARPEPNLDTKLMSHTSRWQLINQISQSFWKRWQSEYLQTLHQRAKWTGSHPNLKRGDLVLVNEKNMPSTQWLTGRIIDTFPGNDGVVRVVRLKTPHGLLLRPVAKLSPFPNQLSCS